MSDLILAQAHEEILTPGTVGGIMWLVPLLPFLAFFVILFFGRKMPDKGHWVGIGAVALGLILSLVGFFELAGGRDAVESRYHSTGS